MTNRKLGSGRTHVTRQKHNKGTRPTTPPRSTESPTLQWQSLLLLVTTTRVPAGIAARANTGRRLLRDTTRTRVARRGWSPRQSAPALMSPTTKDALRVETRRRGLLLWLDSLEVLGESPVVGIAVNGASHGLSNDGQSRLDTPSVRALNSGPQAGDLLDPGISHRRQGRPTGRTSAYIARARRHKQGNRRGGRRAGWPSGIHRPGRRRRAIAPRRTRTVAALLGVANGVSPVPTTAAPHLGVVRSDSSHREWRARVQRPVEIDTRVTKAKAVLLGRVDRDPHLTGFPGVALAPDNVLKDLPLGKRL